MPSNEDVLLAISKLSEQVQRIADALEKQQLRKEYQAAYYKKRKVAKKVALNRIEIRDMHCLECARDPRMPFEMWTERLEQFVKEGRSAYNYICWLAWAWNHNTYNVIPITRSGGYFHVFIGLSGKSPLRSKYSERDVTGHMRVTRFQKPEQLDTFAEALWWKWTFATLCRIVSDCEDEPWFKALGDNWHRPLKVAMGGFGMYEIKGIVFDHTERDLNNQSKAYGLLRPTLTMCWSSFLKGLFCKEEPFLSKKK